MKRLIIIYAVMTAFLVAPASAQPTYENFRITLERNNQFCFGYGTGFNDGTGVEGSPWYYYPNTNWYNQWYYDDPPTAAGYKAITYDILVLPVTGETTLITVAINWSTLAYPQTGPGGPPPLPPLSPQQENDWISRQVIYDGLVYDPINIRGGLIIPDYNPEWVSIDVRAYTFWGFATNVEGYITHECLTKVIPAPGAVLLGSIGVALVGWLRRRRSL